MPHCPSQEIPREWIIKIMAYLRERNIDDEKGCQDEEDNQRPLAFLIFIRDGQDSGYKKGYHQNEREVIIQSAYQSHRRVGYSPAEPNDADDKSCNEQDLK